MCSKQRLVSCIFEGVDHVTEGGSPEPDMSQPETFLEFCTKQICHCATVSVFFLVHLGLAVLPAVCPNNHEICIQVKRRYR